MAKEYVIITGGGKGSRMGSDLPKQFHILNGLPLLMHTINAFFDYSDTINVVLVLPEDHFDTWGKLCKQYNFTLKHILCSGGKTRFHSVKKGLSHVDEKALVAIHDAVRPMASGKLINDCFRVAEEKGSAVPVIPLKDSVRSITAEGSTSLDRESIRLVQTPQVFWANELSAAYDQAGSLSFTDDASIAESAGICINLVDGCFRNIKITTPDDMAVAKALMQ